MSGGEAKALQEEAEWGGAEAEQGTGLRERAEQDRTQAVPSPPQHQSHHSKDASGS